MDNINKLSRKMYEEVPRGGTLFTIDKIGLRIETKYLNKANIKPWFKGRYINIIIYGNIAQINIHAEFEPNQKHLGRRCLDAILVLLYNGVFNYNFICMFYTAMSNMYPYLLCDNSISIILLSLFFTISEWEWAIDFLDYFPFSSVKTDKDDPKSILNYKNTFYSKDGKKLLRTKEENGQTYSELKGVQKSLFCGYDKAKKIESERPIFRTEIRQQGKHKRDLSVELLDGTAEEAFTKELPILKKKINKVMEPNTLELSDHWKKNTPEQYKMLFFN